MVEVSDDPNAPSLSDKKKTTRKMLQRENDILIVVLIIIMLSASFRVNPHSIVCMNIKELLAQSRRHI